MGVGLAERIGETTPTNIAGECTLLVRGGAAVLGLDRFEGFDGGEVVVEFDALGAFTEVDLVGDAEVDGGEVRRLVRRYLLSATSRSIASSSTSLSVSTGGFA